MRRARSAGTAVPAMTLPAVRPAPRPRPTQKRASVRSAKADPGHGGTSGRSDGGAVENAGAEVARGEPGSAELADEVGGEERAGLGVLNVPALDECGQKRTEHDGGDAGDEKVKEDGERARGVSLAGVVAGWGAFDGVFCKSSC